MADRLNGHDRRHQRAERKAVQDEKRAGSDRDRADRLSRRLGEDNPRSERAAAKADRTEEEARRSKAEERRRAAAAHAQKAKELRQELARHAKARKQTERRGLVVKSSAAFAADMLEIKKKIKEEENLSAAAEKEYRTHRRHR